MLGYPHTRKRLASVLLFQLAGVCEVNLLLASAEGLGKTVKCFPVTRKWDSSCARECRKKSRFRRSLVVCTNITLKYSVWNVCSVKQRKTIAGFYNHPRYTSLPTDLFLPSEVCITLFIFVTSVSRGGEIIKKHLGVWFAQSHLLCQTIPSALSNTWTKALKSPVGTGAADWPNPALFREKSVSWLTLERSTTRLTATGIAHALGARINCSGAAHAAGRSAGRS